MIAPRHLLRPSLSTFEPDAGPVCQIEGEFLSVRPGAGEDDLVRPGATFLDVPL